MINQLKYKLLLLEAINMLRLCKRAIIIALIAGLGLFAFKSSAFDPDELTFGHSFITSSITQTGYKSWGGEVSIFAATVTYSAQPTDVETLYFTNEASQQIILGARSMDFLPIKLEGAGVNSNYLEEDGVSGGLSISGDPYNSASHCDDEKILECSRSAFKSTIAPDSGQTSGLLDFVQSRYENESAATLIDYAVQLWRKDNRTQAEENLALAYAAAARVKVGRALHTTQDFYAHSNWSDLPRQGILSQFAQGGEGSSSDAVIDQYSLRPIQKACVSNPVPTETVATIRAYEQSLCSGDTLCLSRTPYGDFAESTDLEPISIPYLGEVITFLTAASSYVKNSILDWNNSGGKENGVRSNLIDHAKIGPILLLQHFQI
jgi:hypothetical protein